MKLETKRLILRDYKKGDETALYKKINNWNISKWLLVVPYPYPKKKAIEWINLNLKKQKEKNRTDFELAITLKPSDELIGGIGFCIKNKDQGIADIGYWIAEEHWRKGLVYEACCELINFGFKNFKIRKIMVPVFAENIASRGVAKKLGAKEEGILRKQCLCKSTGRTHDEIIHGLLKEEWKK
jgi:RimJ/RimL family protein N-acetyltransferase